MVSLTRKSFHEGAIVLKQTIRNEFVHLKRKKLGLDPISNRKSLNIFMQESGMEKGIFKEITNTGVRRLPCNPALRP